MSINSMTTARLVREDSAAQQRYEEIVKIANRRAAPAEGVEPTVPVPSGGGTPPGGTASGAAAPAASQSLLTELTTYIPTEIVAAYTAVAGLLPKIAPGASLCQAGFSSRWIFFVVFAICTPTTVLATYLYKARAAGAKARVPLFEMITASLAFVAWGFMLPLAPIFQWCAWQPQYGLICGTLVLFAIGLAGKFRGPTPPTA
jgi:hypothetical protein